MAKLHTAALIALSVTALEENLAAEAYTAEELAEAITAEKAGENRKTALAALEDAKAEAEAEAEAGNVPRVAKGKAIITLAGIKADGDVITAKMLAGGDETLKALTEKGYIA